MKRLKIAIGLFVVAFLVAVAGSSAFAFWNSQASVTSTAKVASLADSCSNVTSVQNASFETPVINQDWTWIPNGGVPGWVSTDPVGIEIWRSGFMGVAAPVGNQFVELNANIAGTLSQSISTTPGQILQWSLLHRGRAGVDTMQVLIGSSNSTLVPIRTISDGTSAWGRYSGAYVVPAGQTTTELAFRAISTATGDLSVGNFMDDVSFGSGPCLTTAATVSNITNPGSSAYHPGDVVQYSTTVSNIGSALSYKSAVTAALPASITYNAGSLTIDGTTESDASGDDQAEYTAGSGGTGTVTARLGSAASATVGGTVAQGTATVVSFQATVVGAVGTVIHFTPTTNFVNGLAPLWPATPAVATDIPITIALGVDVGFTSATVTPAPATLVAGVSSSPKTWTFVLKNNGTAVANHVVVHLTAPSGFTVTTAPQMSGGVACTTTSSTTADCTIGDLAAAATNTITLSGYAAAGTAAGNFTVSATVTSASGDAVTSNNSTSATVVVSPDVSPPTTVTGLAASGTTGSSTILNWNAATDNASVIGYKVYRGATLIASVTGTTFTDTLLNPSTSYSYTVYAVDSANNVSVAASNTATVTTLAPFTSTTYYRVNATTTLCLTTSAMPAVAASTLILGTCDTASAFQKWSFTQTLNSVTIGTAGTYFVAPDTAGTLLSWDISATSGKADVAKATNAVQEWKPVVETGGLFHFINASSGKCLALPAAAALNQQLVPATCAAAFPSTTQSFTITGVTP